MDAPCRSESRSSSRPRAGPETVRSRSSPAPSPAALSVRPPKRTGEKTSYDDEARDEQPDEIAPRMRRRTEPRRELPLRPLAGVEDRRRGHDAASCASRRHGQDVLGAEASCVRTSHPSHRSPARASIGLGSSATCAPVSPQRRVSHDAARAASRSETVGTQRSRSADRERIEPSCRRGSHARCTRRNLDRRVAEPHELARELPVEVEPVGDELDTLDALSPEDLVHRERVTQPGAVRHVEEPREHPVGRVHDLATLRISSITRTGWPGTWRHPSVKSTSPRMIGSISFG